MLDHQPQPVAHEARHHETHQAFLLLRTVFTIAPIAFGIDKFTNFLVDWTSYLAPLATQIVPVSPQTFMYGVGVVEILAGLLVAWRPKVGSGVLGAWVGGLSGSQLGVRAS